MKTGRIAHRTRAAAAPLAVAAAAPLAAALPASADGLTQLHPGFTSTDIQPSGRSLLVGGLDFFSNGDMAVCNWGNPGDVWLVKGAQNGTTSSVQSVRYAYGMQQVLGCKIVRDTLYVMQMSELTQLVDVDKDGRADQYNRVNNSFSVSESLLGYAYDMEYFGGYFYAALSADVMRGGMTAKPTLANRSAFIKMGRDNSLEYLASGFRNPNGMGVGFGNRLFTTDNQGSWLPSSKIIHLEKGKFYGHRTEPANQFQSQPESPPMVWLPKGSVDHQPGNVEFIPTGIYKNQLLFSEPDDRLNGRIYRISMEEVGGVMQGAVLPFIGGIGNGVMRSVLGPGNAIYSGMLNSNGGWNTLGDMGPGLRRFTPKDNNTSGAFEILAVRSMGNTTIELEFTKPVGPTGSVAGNYAVVTWTFNPVEQYGGGNNADNHALSVSSAAVKPDGKTVVLTISGLKEKYLVHIRIPNLRSTDNETPWTNDAWFTLNKFGPGKVPAIAGCMDNRNPDYNPNAVVNDPAACGPGTVGLRSGGFNRAPLAFAAGRVRVDLPAGAAYTLRLYDVRGAELRRWQGRGPGEMPAPAGKSGASGGVYFLRLQAGAQAWTRMLTLTP